MVDYDDLRRDPAATFGRLLDFLSVDASPDTSIPESANRRALARFPGVNRFLHTSMLKRGLRSVLPSGIKSWLRRIYFVDAGEETLDASDGALIRQCLADDAERLAERLADAAPAWLRQRLTRSQGLREESGNAWR